MPYEYLCENYTCLPEEAVESGEVYCWGTDPCALLKSTKTLGQYCLPDNVMAHGQGSLSGMTFKRLTETNGEENAILCQEDSPARTLARTENAPESTEQNPVFGEKWPEWFAKYDPVSSSWKIRQIWLFADLDESLETWPRWGLMQDGECFQLAPLVCHTCGKECSSLPTPLAEDDHGGGMIGRQNRKNLRDWCTERGLYLLPQQRNPEFWEWLMAWPLGATALEPLETDKFQQWLRSHGKL
jgi:hypothetical protein